MLGPDGGGYPRTICPDLWDRRVGSHTGSPTGQPARTSMDVWSPAKHRGRTGPSRALATRQATRRGHLRRPAMAATSCHRSPSATADPSMPDLVERLNNLTRAGFDATQLVRSAAAAAPLRDDHPAAALWWRIFEQLPQTPNQEQPPRQSQRPGARPRPHTTSSHRCRAGRRLPRSAQAAETSALHKAGEVFSNA